ncbi:MAG: zf-HC2 domain-containing protein [Armatimonadetes bacterium]|nr:zf-HC2 domain-containing protein [Armatimonadota bacterium]MDW8026930.1 zf-HC2 domain-containing protein [Armatimonadota bacterium]
MSCDWARKLMVLADGLSKEEQLELQKHLQECKSCNSEWLNWQRLFALIGQLPSISSTQEERAELMKALRHLPSVHELTCATAEKQIWRWLDDDLSKEEVASLIVHLANCDRCQSHLWRAERTVQILRSLPILKATQAEKEAIKAKLKRMSKRSNVMPFLWRVALPIAAASILVLLAISRLPTPQLGNQTTIVRSENPKPIVKSQPNIVKSHPIELALTAPKVAKETQANRRSNPLPQKPESKVAVLPKQFRQPLRPHQPIRAVKAERNVVDKKVSATVQVSDGKVEPEPPKPEPVINEPKTSVAELSKSETQQLPVVPVPSELAAVPTKLEPNITASETQTLKTPVIAKPETQLRQLIALPPITVDAELPIEPPKIKLTVVPPSQRLYQQSGVAFVTVPPEKRPIKPPEEKALTSDLSIPMAAERYRSHTATIPFFRFGLSW